MESTMNKAYDYNYLFDNYTLPDLTDDKLHEIQPIQIATLVFYSIVILLGVPGNALVVWVTGFCMKHTVTSLWFLNLALADLLCCLSLPLLMVQLAHDDHWHFGPVGCTLIKSVFYLVMFCSILQLVLISVDRWMLVTIPIWCQNNRRPRMGVWGCVAVWCLALIGSIPQFVYTKEIKVGNEKRQCVGVHTIVSARVVVSYRFLVGFLIPLSVIVACHWAVYRKAEGGLSKGRTRSKRTLKVILAVVVSFFLCWLPIHIVDILSVATPRRVANSSAMYFAHILTLCLAYFNSCLNPLLYVCMGKGFQESMSRSLGNMLNFISEEPTVKVSLSNDTKSNETDTTKV